MENIENSKDPKEKKSAKELANMLLEKYPDKIKNIELSNLENIEEAENFEQKISNNIEKNLVKLCLDFKNRPIIQDIFENDNPRRRDFITEVTENGSNEELQKFFDSNKLKISNTRRIAQLIVIAKQNLPTDIVNHAEDLLSHIDEYSNMSDEQKIAKSKEVENLASEIISYYLDKYK